MKDFQHHARAWISAPRAVRIQPIVALRQK